jgi:hypothetical protein
MAENQCRHIVPLTTAESNKDAAERLLKSLSSEELASLAQKLSTSSLQQEQTASITEVMQPFHLEPLTSKILAKNNKKLDVLPTNTSIIDIFRPDLSNQCPADIIKHCTSEYEKNPSSANAQLLQQVINSYTSVNNVDSGLQKGIDKAMLVLHQGSEALDDIWYIAYVDAQFRGGAVSWNLPTGWIYLSWPWVGSNINDKISSLKVFATSDEVGGDVILFQNSNYNGTYEIFPITIGRGRATTERDYSYVGAAMNDQTSSILTVRRFANENPPVKVSQLVPASDITSIINSYDSVSARGNPIWSWDLWPAGGSGHPNDPSKMFLYLNVPISVDTHSIFGHYNCEIHYWIYLYINSSGSIEGYVNWWNVWVEGGWITGRVLNGLSAKIPSTIGQVNAKIASALSTANLFAPFGLLYYLPGNADGVYPRTGNTNDGVTIVTTKRLS